MHYDPTADKSIYFYYYDVHLYVITAMSWFLNQKYFYLQYKKSYD